MDLPVHGEVGGEWDLRKNVDKFLGKASLEGKRVLDVGTASGFLTFTRRRARDFDTRRGWPLRSRRRRGHGTRRGYRIVKLRR